MNAMLILRLVEKRDGLFVFEPVTNALQAECYGRLEMTSKNTEWLAGIRVGDEAEFELRLCIRQGEVVSRNSIGGSSLDGAFVRDSVRVLSAAHALNGDMERSLWWFRHKVLPDLGDRTPETMVRNGEVQAVLDYLGTLL